MFLTSELYRLIGFDQQLLFDSLIMAFNILVLFAGLSYLLYNPVRKVLSQRTEKIKKDIDDASEKLKDANEAKIEYEKKLADVRIEVEKIIESAKKSAKDQSDEIIENARKEANAIVERGEREIILEKQKAMDELKSEVVNIATLLATKVIKKSINEQEADKMFSETLEQIGANTWQK